MEHEEKEGNLKRVSVRGDLQRETERKCFCCSVLKVKETICGRWRSSLTC